MKIYLNTKNGVFAKHKLIAESLDDIQEITCTTSQHEELLTGRCKIVDGKIVEVKTLEERVQALEEFIKTLTQ